MLTSIVLFVLLGFIAGFASSQLLYQESVQKLTKVGKQRGIHVHHSMYGVGIFAFVPLLHLPMMTHCLLYGFAIGIILDHTLQEGLLFITRESHDRNTELFASGYFLFLLALYMHELAHEEMFAFVNNYQKEL
jgi:hypothetical protein